MSYSYWLTWASLTAAVLALACGAVGLATPYWASLERGNEGSGSYRNEYEGLWRHCLQIGTAERECADTMDRDNDVWFEIVQALVVMGCFGELMGVLTMLCWACTYRLSSCIKVTILMTLFFGFVFMAGSVILYKLEYPSYDGAPTDLGLSWSFYLTVASAVFAALSFGMLVPVGPSLQGRYRYPSGYPLFSFMGSTPRFLSRRRDFTYGGYPSRMFGGQPNIASYYKRPSPIGMISESPYSFRY